MGGGALGVVESTTPPFIFVKAIEKIIRLCAGLIFFFSGSFEDMGIYTHLSIYLLWVDITQIKPNQTDINPIKTKLKSNRHHKILKIEDIKKMSTVWIFCDTL